MVSDNIIKKNSSLSPDVAKLSAIAGSIRLQWSVLNQMNIDASSVRIRSKLFQRYFTESQSQIPVYVKIYTYRKHPLHRFCRRGRSRIETRNLLFFKNIGIPVPRVIGWGERRIWWGKLEEEFIITETIADAQPLDVFVEIACPDRSRPLYAERRDKIIDQVACWTRKLHAHHFFHKDLYWRNILARLTNEEIELFWIDCPTGGFYPLPIGYRHRQLKDCATLDNLARVLCTREERKRFVASYLGCAADDPNVLKFGQALTRYRRRRFDSRHGVKESMPVNF
ncbi:MAG: lipopolysaccharide kinase InaA family protein [Dissulfuribacterales bacterium]